MQKLVSRSDPGSLRKDEFSNNVLHLMGFVQKADAVYYEGTLLPGIYWDGGFCSVFHTDCDEIGLTAGKVVVHEIGHRCGLLPWDPLSSPAWMKHIDSAVISLEKHAHDCNEADQHCMMSYRVSTGEFCVHCLYHLRDRGDQ